MQVWKLMTRLVLKGMRVAGLMTATHFRLFLLRCLGREHRGRKTVEIELFCMNFGLVKNLYLYFVNHEVFDAMMSNQGWLWITDTLLFLFFFFWTPDVASLLTDGAEKQWRKNTLTLTFNSHLVTYLIYSCWPTSKINLIFPGKKSRAVIFNKVMQHIISLRHTCCLCGYYGCWGCHRHEPTSRVCCKGTFIIYYRASETKTWRWTKIKSPTETSKTHKDVPSYAELAGGNYLWQSTRPLNENVKYSRPVVLIRFVLCWGETCW